LKKGGCGGVFGEKLKAERTRKGWSQEELAEKLFVSRQSVSKWENGQNYPSIEMIIKLSELFGVTVDELLKSDAALTDKVIQDGKRPSYPRLKLVCDVLFLLGVALLFIKIAVMLLNRAAGLDIPLYGGAFLWNFGSLFLIFGAGALSKMLKEKAK
jgi:transcriptional regulator with XRE-family HTH domain